MALDKVKDDMLQDNLVFPGSTAQFPSITTDQRNALTPAVGMVIYNTSIGNLQQYTATGWASIAAPPAITSLTYPTESGAVLTALDATGSSDAAQTLIINGSNFTGTVTVEILVGGTYSAFSSSTSVNGARTQITCTGVTKRAAADNYTLKVTNTTGLNATTTVNFSADPSFSTAANLGNVIAGQTLNKSIAFTGTKVFQGATAKPTWLTVTGNTSTADNGASDTTFDATGSPAVLGGTIAAPASNNTQNHTFSIIVRDAENQTFNRDFSLTAVTAPTGGDSIVINGGYRYHRFSTVGNSASFEVFAGITIEYLVVAGGGSGGGAGGGGAGGVRVGSHTFSSASNQTITVGAGGAHRSSNLAGNDGDNSSIGSLIVATGGGGGGNYQSPQNGRSGGSGGGAGWMTSQASTGGSGIQDSGTFGTATYQGHAGGNNAYYTNGTYSSGGGGGAGGGGQDAQANDTSGNGGAGRQPVSWATPFNLGYVNTGGQSHNGVADDVAFYFAGGGGGGAQASPGTAGNGGSGGGGGGAVYNSGSGNSAGTGGTGGINNGQTGDVSVTNAAGGSAGENTGGGGGGMGISVHTSGAGGSGIVVIRYAI